MRCNQLTAPFPIELSTWKSYCEHGAIAVMWWLSIRAKIRRLVRQSSAGTQNDNLVVFLIR